MIPAVARRLGRIRFALVRRRLGQHVSEDLVELACAFRDTFVRPGRLPLLVTIGHEPIVPENRLHSPKRVVGSPA